MAIIIVARLVPDSIIDEGSRRLLKYFVTQMNVCATYMLFSCMQENDCMALELKYKEAVQKKEEAEKNLTKRVRLKLCPCIAS